MKLSTVGNRVALLTTFFVFTPGAASADDDLITNWGSWIQLVGEGSLKFVNPSLEKGRLWLEGQSRWDDDWKHWYQGMARTALGYSLSDRATVWVGYTFLPTQNLGQPYFAQQDVWPAFRYHLPTEYGNFTYRIMWESNFIRGNQVRERPRQMLAFRRPFEFEQRLSLVLWDEIFVRINTTQWGGQSGFDQNRAFLGLGWTFNPTFRSELGYLNQYIDNANHSRSTMRNLILASLFVNF